MRLSLLMLLVGLALLLWGRRSADDSLGQVELTPERLRRVRPYVYGRWEGCGPKRIVGDRVVEARERFVAARRERTRLRVVRRPNCGSADAAS